MSTLLSKLKLAISRLNTLSTDIQQSTLTDRQTGLINLTSILWTTLRKLQNALQVNLNSADLIV